MLGEKGKGLGWIRLWGWVLGWECLGWEEEEQQQ